MNERSFIRKFMISQTKTKGEQTQAAIVESAYRLFLAKGFHGTSMRQIAQNAGIAVGGIYNHYSSKEEVFLAVLFAYHPYHTIVPAMIALHGENLEEFVHQAAAKMVEALEQNPNFLNLMFIEIVEFNSRHIALLFESIYPQLDQFSQRFYRLRDSIRPIPPPILLRAFLGLFFSYYITERLIGDLFPQDFRAQGLEYFVDIYLHGILTRGGSE